MGVPYARQLADKTADANGVLGLPADVWLPSVPSEEHAFRNKAKMAVGGTVDAPTLGILDARRAGVDLRGCGVCAPGLTDAFPHIARFITLAGIVPYDVAARRGELKHVLLSESAEGELLLRFVLRSTEPVLRIRKHAAALTAWLPRLRTVTVNVQPEHKAVIEGPTELPVAGDGDLPVRFGDLLLHQRPGAFVQTNTAIATSLYAQAAEWADAVAPRSVWDLYCGIGGFALTLAGAGREVLGVEVSESAIAGAARSAAESGHDVRFVAADATAWAAAQPTPPDLVVVNPPRRGLGTELCAWLDASGAAVLYSSCNPASLARDLAAMPSYRVDRARLFDMFPQTAHAEVMVLLRPRQGTMPAVDSITGASFLPSAS